MPKLEDLLKSKGYTDADLTSLAPLLADSRFRTTLEEQVANLETERDLFKNQVTEFEDWRQKTAIPKFDEIAAREAEARQESARLREEIKIARDYGYLPPEKQPPPVDPQVARATNSAAVAQAEAFDPAKHNLVTRDEIGRFANLEGEAIAMATDLAEEYRILYPGQSIYSYEGQNGTRGMRALRLEALAKKQNLDSYISEKFAFPTKRAEVDAKRLAEAEEAIRKDERAKVAAEYGNPALRVPMASRFPFIPKKPQEGGQPWEKSPSELRDRRLANAIKNQVQ